MRMRLWLAVGVCVCLVIVLGGRFFVLPNIGSANATLREYLTAAAFFVQGISVDDIQQTYWRDESSGRSQSTAKVRILIVPGHQPNVGGTEFKGVYERDIVADIANQLATLLAQNPRYEVFITRGKAQWNSWFEEYFDTNVKAIETFRDRQIAQMQKHVATGRFVLEPDQVFHNAASPEASIQLYGINRWANEHKVDIALHLHINDHAGRRAGRPGRYEGFAVYVPDSQYSNAIASRAIGDALARRLNAYHATSTFPGERAGVVSSRELIAIGSNNTADSAAALIEYAYIYEPHITDTRVRDAAVADYAYQTYLGLQDFFEDPVRNTYGTTVLPHDWQDVSLEVNGSGRDVYALQTALRYLGWYPPKGESLSNCPITGTIGSCTESALKAYQTAHGLDAVGRFGPQTRTRIQQDLDKELKVSSGAMLYLGTLWRLKK